MQQEVVQARVGLLDLVEEHQALRLARHRLHGVEPVQREREGLHRLAAHHRAADVAGLPLAGEPGRTNFV